MVPGFSSLIKLKHEHELKQHDFKPIKVIWSCPVALIKFKDQHELMKHGNKL